MILFDKLQQISGMVLNHAMEGKFHVMYDDGKKSQNFDYSTAKGYAEIFGGKVYHSETNKCLS